MTGPDSPKPNPVNEWLGLMSGAVEEVRTVLARVPGEMVRLPLVALSAALELRERLRHEDGPGSLGVGETERPARPAAEKPKLADVRDLRPAPEAARQPLRRSRPARSRPARSRPASSRPARSRPASSRSASSRSASSRPASSRPASSRPASSRSASSRSASSRPASTAPPAPAPAGPAPAAPGAPPLADFDTMTVASLRGRLRTLDLPTLIQLRGWESRHGARAGILSMLDHRINKLSAEATGSH